MVWTRRRRKKGRRKGVGEGERERICRRIVMVNEMLNREENRGIPLFIIQHNLFIASFWQCLIRIILILKVLFSTFDF